MWAVSTMTRCPSTRPFHQKSAHVHQHQQHSKDRALTNLCCIILYQHFHGEHITNNKIKMSGFSPQGRWLFFCHTRGLKATWHSCSVSWQTCSRGERTSALPHKNTSPVAQLHICLSLSSSHFTPLLLNLPGFSPSHVHAMVNIHQICPLITQPCTAS